MNLVDLKTGSQQHVDDAKGLLLEAADKGFEAVVIVGLAADGTVWCKKSKTLDTMKFIGAIEFAKETTIKSWT